MNEEIPYRPPELNDYIREGARKNSALLRKMRGQPETSATAEAKGGSLQPAGSALESNLEWAERELMKLQDSESDPELRALWSTAARIARERISNGKGKVPNAQALRPAGK